MNTNSSKRLVAHRFSPPTFWGNVDFRLFLSLNNVKDGRLIKTVFPLKFSKFWAVSSWQLPTSAEKKKQSNEQHPGAPRALAFLLSHEAVSFQNVRCFLQYEGRSPRGFTERGLLQGWLLCNKIAIDGLASCTHQGWHSKQPCPVAGEASSFPRSNNPHDLPKTPWCSSDPNLLSRGKILTLISK